MLIVITGATGFVGENIKEYFKDKVDFLVIGRENLPAILPEELGKANSIIHLAGKAHDLKNSNAPDEYYKVNFELTKRLYDAFLRSEVKKFIFLSSVKAVADVVEGVLTEETHPDPKTDYGRSKYLAEQYILSQPLPKGKSFYILRPCMIHGPNNKGNLNLLYKVVKNGIPYPLASFENRRSFLSIDNLCFVVDELIHRSTIPSGIYQIADDEALSTNELVALMCGQMGKKVKLYHIPIFIIKKLARLGDMLKLPLNTERLKKLTENYIVSNEKIGKVLGQRLPVSARQGILKTISSFGEIH